MKKTYKNVLPCDMFYYLGMIKYKWFLIFFTNINYLINKTNKTLSDRHKPFSSGEKTEWRKTPDAQYPLSRYWKLEWMYISTKYCNSFQTMFHAIYEGRIKSADADTEITPLDPVIWQHCIVLSLTSSFLVSDQWLCYCLIVSIC